jgi:hypothetical protein
MPENGLELSDSCGQQYLCHLGGWTLNEYPAIECATRTLPLFHECAPHASETVSVQFDGHVDDAQETG